MRGFVIYNFLQVNLYLLGAVYIQLVKLLRLEEHPSFIRPVDPSLYIHRFADKLGFGKSMHMVANTTIRIISSMKRDWMQVRYETAHLFVLLYTMSLANMPLSAISVCKSAHLHCCTSNN